MTSDGGQEQFRITSQSQLMKEFMTVMSVAHEVVAEDPTTKVKDLEAEESEVDPQQLIYQGPSPDEVTLVEFARNLGFCFCTGNDSLAKIQVDESKWTSNNRS